jgi:hypothetical protein
MALTLGVNNPVPIIMDSDKSVTASFALNVITVLTDRASVSVPEGGVTNFQVKLSAQPTGDTVVAIAWTAGDTDISISGGAILTFTTGDWASYQTATLAAAEDNSDNLNGSATITCSGTELTNAAVEATEIDDEYTLAVTSPYGTVALNPDTPYYDNGTHATLTATPSASYLFTGWSGDLIGSWMRGCDNFMGLLQSVCKSWER